eukprot:9070731-Karenia_brevis.AAC.1
MTEEASIHLDLWEVDLLRGEKLHDLAEEAVWDKVCKEVRTADVVLVTPPCNTHSRALWANPNGPCPVRNKSYPRGFPWLSGPDKA